ncbi:hypothetical protein EBZ80_20895 [bacterium]|nr:hypothetical protein [bacterium]
MIWFNQRVAKMSAFSLNRKSALLFACFAFAVSSCSKRDPAIDTSKPVASPGQSRQPGLQTPGGNSTVNPGGNRPYTPPSTIPGGSNGSITPYRPITPSGPGTPSYPNNNNSSILPPSRPITPPSVPNVLPPSRPNAPNVIPNPPVVPIQPPAANGDVSIAMQVVMTQDGPKVKAAIPANVTNMKMQYLSVTGMTEGTNVDVSLSFSNGAKTCSIAKTTVRTESQTVTVPCK